MGSNSTPTRLSPLIARVFASASLIGLCCGALITAPAASGAAPSAPVIVPSFRAGPMLTGRTVLWQGERGIEAVSPEGTPRLVRAGGTLSELAVGDGWVALADAGRVLAGPATGRLEQVSLPRGCQPVVAEVQGNARSKQARPLLAIERGQLIEVVGPRCKVPRRSTHDLRLVTFDTDGGHARVLGTLAHKPLAIAAGAGAVVLGSITSRRESRSVQQGESYEITTVRTRGSHSVTWTYDGISPEVSVDVEVDDEGDLFADALLEGHFGPPGEWDDTSGLVVSREGGDFEVGLSVPIPPLLETAASISDGQLATLRQNSIIEVLDVADHATLATVELAAGHRVLGVALEGSTLAWIDSRSPTNSGRRKLVTRAPGRPAATSKRRSDRPSSSA